MGIEGKGKKSVKVRKETILAVVAVVSAYYILIVTNMQTRL